MMKHALVSICSIPWSRAAFSRFRSNFTLFVFRSLDDETSPFDSDSATSPNTPPATVPLASPSKYTPEETTNAEAARPRSAGEDSAPATDVVDVYTHSAGLPPSWTILVDDGVINRPIVTASQKPPLTLFCGPGFRSGGSLPGMLWN